MTVAIVIITVFLATTTLIAVVERRKGPLPRGGGKHALQGSDGSTVGWSGDCGDGGGGGD